jgi:hypothetical protein
MSMSATSWNNHELFPTYPGVRTRAVERGKRVPTSGLMPVKIKIGLSLALFVSGPFSPTNPTVGEILTYLAWTVHGAVGRVSLALAREELFSFLPPDI